MDREALVVATRSWIAGDPDPGTRGELETLLAAGAFEELAERMAGSLAFGTAGLRGRVEAGSSRMNRAVVIRTTRGIVDYLQATGAGIERPIVVGRDARLSSETLMRDTVGVIAAAGLPVRYFPGPTPTPLVAYAARKLRARMAIIVTASHNPPWDNGYKVYDGNGVQIVPPVDAGIAAAIDAVGAAKDVARIRDPFDGSADAVAPMPDDTFSGYLDAIGVHRHGITDRSLTVVHTPLHGVGGRSVMQALSRYGGHRVIPVAEQFEPDGRFPTVAFPNPEEPGALDLALNAAVEEDADVVIANDPDTDRLAVAVPGAGGSWRVLSGNQLGVLLAEHILAATPITDPIVIDSIVSTPMLESIARFHGARFAATLTGFKWIWNAALDLEEAGEGTFVFGFEEALGYSVTPVVRDKDGISAAVVFADLVAAALDEGVTVLDRLGALYGRHGLWASAQHSIVRDGTGGAAEIDAAVERAASAPPAALGDDAVTGIEDYRSGSEHRPRYLGAASLVRLDLASGGRVLVRPSGTEPKLKIYADLTAKLDAPDRWVEAEAALVDHAGRAARELAGALGLG